MNEGKNVYFSSTSFTARQRLLTLSTFLAMAKWAAHHSRNSIIDSSQNRQVEELTKNIDILNKYKKTQFLENEVFANIEIS